NSGNSLEITTRPAKRRWVEIIINLSQLGTPSSIKRVLVKNANTSSTSMYFDQIQLTNILEPSTIQALIFNPDSDPFNSSLTMDIYPNPASQSTTLEISRPMSLTATPTQIELFDMTGRILKTKTLLNASGNSWEEIDLNGLNAGSYVIRVRYGQELVSKRLLIRN
ncbi:MAG: T9SS type A sorting domain-containing protein, partial [Chitinophagaceae bacterium]